MCKICIFFFFSILEYYRLVDVVPLKGFMLSKFNVVWVSTEQ